MDYTFQNLLGAPYKGGTVTMAGDTLLSPVGNRVSQVIFVCMACHMSPIGVAMAGSDDSSRYFISYNISM
jgi:hypothetical protein